MLDPHTLMTPELQLIQQQLQLLSVYGRRRLLRVVWCKAHQKALPLAILSLPLVPLTQLLLQLFGLAGGSLLWGLILALVLAVFIYVAVVGQRLLAADITERQSLAIFDDELATQQRMLSAAEFLKQPSINGFQAAAINDAQPVIRRALAYRFAPLAGWWECLSARTAGATVLAFLILVIGQVWTTSASMPISAEADSPVIGALTDAKSTGTQSDTPESETNNKDAKEGSPANANPDKPPQTATSRQLALNTQKQKQVPNDNLSVELANHQAAAGNGASDSIQNSGSQSAGAGGQSGANNQANSTSITSSAMAQVKSENRVEVKSGKSTRESQQAAQPLPAKPHSAGAESGEISQPEIAADTSSDSREAADSGSDSSQTSADGQASAQGATPANAAAKGAKPAADARKNNQQQQQNQSGNQSNRNSQNSGNQAGDEGQKQSRGIGGLMLSVPMADQFIGTAGPGPQTRKNQQIAPPEQGAYVPAGEYRGVAKGNTGQQVKTNEEAWELRILQSFYQRSDDTTTDQNSDSRGQK